MSAKSELRISLLIGAIFFIAVAVYIQREYKRAQNWVPGTYDGQHFGSPPSRYKLKGTAKGGTLCLLGPTRSHFALVQTKEGEPTPAILKRLADEINRSDPFCWNSDPYGGGPVTRSGPPPMAKVDDDVLIMPGSYYYFSGSDSGFNFPGPVLSLSGSHDSKKKQLTVFWINPPNNYDEIVVQGNILPPGATNFILTYRDDPPRTVSVKTRQKGMVSLPAEIVIGPNSQEELENYPFYHGLSPNWSKWVHGAKPDEIDLKQGRKPDVDPRRTPTEPDEKPFYQLIKTTRAGVQGGIYRRFFGLIPGNTYRVQMRLNTLDMDASTNNWSFSFHAAADNPHGKGLTVDQLAGLAALPDGAIGTSAAEVAHYGPGTTTKGLWVNHATDDLSQAQKNIKLPSHVTSITVWLRVSGSSPDSVGMDWIKVEDVTHSRKN
jgi:hypothetical protein